MPDILLELLCEEIPARMQIAAMEHLKKAITTGLVDAGLHYEDAKAYVTPRRLTLHVVNVPIATKPMIVERKGPRVGAPEGAIQGFLKAAGLAKIEDAQTQDDGKGGQFYIAKTQKDGQPTAAVLKPLIEKTIAEFPWPKSMRWGSGSLTWVRPLHNVCCTFSSDTDVEVIEVEVENVTSKAQTRGHTFLSPAPFAVKRFDDYVQNLEKNYVVLDRERRKQIIWHDAKTAAFAQGLEVIPDDGLLEEIAGLVEWPVVLMGSFDEAFLSIPERVIQTTIRVNQKCFVLKRLPTCGGAVARSVTEGGKKRFAEQMKRSSESFQVSNARSDAKGRESKKENPSPYPLPPILRPTGFGGHSKGEGSSSLSNHFILVSNLAATDGGKTIVAGNQRVIRARLSDAKFFWENDQKISLEKRAEGLKNVVFHERLGTQWDRVQRIESIALNLFNYAGSGWDRYRADHEKFQNFLALTVRISKADLLTEMVGEFPELQGYMGRKYAEIEGLPAEFSDAIEDHYRPRGPSETTPTNEFSINIALADKIDQLVNFWRINEKPTSSRDPFALRRAALGVIRIMRDNEFKMPLKTLIDFGVDASIVSPNDAQLADLLSFFVDRTRIMMVEEGLPHDCVAAVLKRFSGRPFRELFERTKTIHKFLNTEKGMEFLMHFRRANNILTSEEAKLPEDVFATIPTLSDPQEIYIFEPNAEYIKKYKNSGQDTTVEQYVALANMSERMHDYIENNMINDPNQEVRIHRLQLLNYYRILTRTIANFELIEG